MPLEAHAQSPARASAAATERYALMRTDWALVRRLAAELHERLSGARVQDGGALPDGRLALVMRNRGAQIALAFDLFGSPPVVTVERGELVAADAPGFARSLARVLRGFSLTAVNARAHDRVVILTFRTRSRFGVDDEVDLYLELVPRFGNAVLVKNGVVIDACKEFTAAQSARVTQPGRAYEPPPLPPARLPRLVEESGASQGALAALEGDAVLHDPLYVYRRAGTLVQAHLLPLPQLGPRPTREISLLDLLAEDRAQRAQGAAAAGAQDRRRALIRRVETQLHHVCETGSALRSQAAQIEERETLRREGEGIYASLHELDAAAQTDAKDRAAKLFTRYRKLAAALPHLERRRRSLALQQETLETLLWEAQRIRDADLVEIVQALDALDRRTRRAPAAARTRRRRTPLEIRAEGGSRILVGRSPLENVELTFRTARPHDLWFHARGVPGAHVILARDDRSAPPERDVVLAASLAAAHSKARDSARVDVDYTLRKHVRKRPDAPPGLVFYTGAKTISVAPQRDKS